MFPTFLALFNLRGLGCALEFVAYEGSSDAELTAFAEEVIARAFGPGLKLEGVVKA